MKNLLLLIALLSCFSLTAQIDTLNQIVIASSGKVLVSGNYRINFTLGEVVIEIFQPPTSEIILTQGFHQPDSIDLNPPVSIEHAEVFEGEVNVFPNPTNSLINIDLEFTEMKEIDISIYDISGKRLMHSAHKLKEAVIEKDIGNFPQGHYFLEIITPKNQLRQSYKITKI